MIHVLSLLGSMMEISVDLIFVKEIVSNVVYLMRMDEYLS